MADVGDGAVLVAGKAEGKEPANAGVDGGCGCQDRGALAVAQVPAAQGKGQLEDQKLLVDEPAARLLGCRQRRREVDLAQRLG